jgi:hypothetical protein
MQLLHPVRTQIDPAAAVRPACRPHTQGRAMTAARRACCVARRTTCGLRTAGLPYKQIEVKTPHTKGNWSDGLRQMLKFSEKVQSFWPTTFPTVFSNISRRQKICFCLFERPTAKGYFFKLVLPQKPFSLFRSQILSKK